MLLLIIPGSPQDCLEARSVPQVCRRLTPAFPPSLRSPSAIVTGFVRSSDAYMAAINQGDKIAPGENDDCLRRSENYGFPSFVTDKEKVCDSKSYSGAG